MATSESPAADQDTGEEIDVEALLAQPEEQYEADHAELDEEPDLAEADTPPKPIGATCSTEFHAVHKSETRADSQISLIIIHCTQSNSARSSAQWFANPASAGSAHLVVDDIQCYRTLSNEEIPWGAPGTNKNGFHIEHTGFAEWTSQQWMGHEDTLRRGAFKAALHAKKFSIPVKVLSAADLRHGRKGFATHATVTQAFGGSHTDPGAHFPLDHYMDLVQGFADDI